MHSKGVVLLSELEKRAATFVGAATSFALSPGDIVSKCIVGIVTGVSVWCITSLIRHVIRRLRKQKRR